MTAIEQLEQDIVAAATAGDLSWEAARRMLANLPQEDGCPHCGGRLDPRGWPEDRAWQCAACGRLHLEGAVEGTYLDDLLPELHRRQATRYADERRSA